MAHTYSPDDRHLVQPGEICVECAVVADGTALPCETWYGGSIAIFRALSRARRWAAAQSRSGYACTAWRCTGSDSSVDVAL
jgi:hypothetical protein